MISVLHIPLLKTALRNLQQEDQISKVSTRKTIAENIYSIHDTNLQDRRIVLTLIAETLGTSRKRVFHIVHHDLGMRKDFTKRIAICFNAEACTVEKLLISHCHYRGNIIIHHYDSETKQQSK